MNNADPDRRQDLGLPWLPSDPDPPPHNCRNGWLPDQDGCAVPCRRCKPHLRRERLPDGRTAWRATRNTDQAPPNK